MNRLLRNVLVTGGSGFIGSNLIRFLLSEKGFEGRIVNLDALTYAGNPENLADVANDERYVFVRGSITDADTVSRLFSRYSIDTVVHLAAESHVDRSIHGPKAFMDTNVIGTFCLLEGARTAWKGKKGTLFHHVSTDEVYGTLGETGFFTEETAYDPRSPYSATKASSDHLVRAYHHTYGLSITLTNCSNNYGPYQFPEKLIPLMILNMLDGKDLPVYGDGKNIRDWLYVEDHNRAVWEVMKRGRTGESYNIGGENEWENITLVRRLCDIVAEEASIDADALHESISFVGDRPGHDRRYAIDCSKVKEQVSWKQNVSFEEGLRRTVRWYIDNREWAARVRSGAYREWIDKNYGSR